VEAWVEAGRIKRVRAQDQVRGGGERCRLQRELHGAASTKPAPATSGSPKGNSVCCKICLTRANGRLGFACSMSATTPATLGAAAEVPKKASKSGTVVLMSSMPEIATGL